MHPTDDKAIREGFKLIIKEVPIKRLTQEGETNFDDILIDEVTLTLTVIRDKGSHSFTQDGHTLADLKPQKEGCSTHKFALCADRIDDFLIGWLRSSEFIRKFTDILEMTIEEKENDIDEWFASVRIASDVNNEADQTRALVIDIPMSTAWFLDTFDQQDKDGELFKLTGSSHVLGLYDLNGKQLDLVEDISRHVTFDKLIGRAVKNDVNLASCMLLTSCRLTGSIVIKGIASGLPLMASRAAVSSRALSLAKKHNVRLIGFARGGRMSKYS